MRYAAESGKRFLNDYFIASEITSAAGIPSATEASANRFTVIIVVRGNISIHIDRQPRIAGPNALVYSGSERLVRLHSFSENFYGKVISFDRDMVNINASGSTSNAFLYMHQHPVLQLAEDEMAEMSAVFSILKDRHEKKAVRESGKVFHCLLMTFYFQLMECIEKRVHKAPQPLLSHKENLYKRFLALLRENVRKEHSVTFYADRLCLTPQYISSVLKDISGKTANKWIDEMLLAEAKMLLFSTENNIQQIADKLHFSDQSSFGKFFKKMTGFSPTNYKKLRMV